MHSGPGGVSRSVSVECAVVGQFGGGMVVIMREDRESVAVTPINSEILLVFFTAESLHGKFLAPGGLATNTY